MFWCSRVRLFMVVVSVAVVSAVPTAAGRASEGGWVQHEGPVLVASQPWEAGSVQEPTVIHDHGLYRMWYSGGWERCALGYATSRDGIHWRKFSANPVLGLGKGGVSAQVCHSSVFKSGHRWYAYYSSREGSDGDRSLRGAVSPDGIRWHKLSDPVLLPDPASDSLIVNTSVVRASKGLVMLYEAAEPPDYLWRMFAAIDMNSTWRKLGMLPTLDVGGTYGGPSLMRSGNHYQLWFHASTNGWVLPTDIYYSQSTDLLTWTAPTRVLAREQAWEVDQVADPSVVTSRQRTLLYFSGVDNPLERAAIGVAIG